MTPRFSISSRWLLRLGSFAFYLACFSTEGLSQNTMVLPANSMQILYNPPLPSSNGGKHNHTNNNDPSQGWITSQAGGSIIAFTSDTSANATFTFFGSSIQILASAFPTGTSAAIAIITLDSNSTTSRPPYEGNGVLFSAASLNPALPHTVVVQKSQESSADDVVVISSIDVVGFNSPSSSSISNSQPTMITSPRPPVGATSATTNHSLSNGVIAAIAVLVTLAVLLVIGLLFFVRRRRRRLAHQVDPLVIDPPKQTQTRHRPLPKIRTRLPHYRAPPSINPPSSPGTTVAHNPRALEGIMERMVLREDTEPVTYSTLPPLSILRPITPPPPPIPPSGSPGPSKRRSLFVANPSTILSSLTLSSGKSRAVPVEKAEYADEKEKPVIDYDPPPPPAAPSRSLRRFFTTNPGSSAYTTSSVSSSSSKKSKRNRSRSNSNTSSVPQVEDTAPPAPLLVQQPQSPVLSVVEEEVTHAKRARSSRLTFYTANPTDDEGAGSSSKPEERYTSEVKGPRPNKGKKKAST